MRWDFNGAVTLPAGTTASFAVSDPGSRWQQPAYHLYVLGLAGTGNAAIFGSGGQVQVQLSPDAGGAGGIPDSLSRWTSPASLKFTSAGDVFFNAKFRKARVVFTGGDNTTVVTVEIV